MPYSLQQRFKCWFKLTEFVDGHWLYVGHLSNTGYAHVHFNGIHMGLHRVSAHLFLGLDLKNHLIQALHKPTCPYRNCWNPECLYLGTQSNNISDRWESRRIRKFYG